MQSGKRNTSVRLNANDLRRVEGIADRLEVSESELIRFCIKNTLNRMSPLDDPSYVGADLVPILLDIGEDMTRYFELNSRQLKKIVNGVVAESSGAVADSDVDLFALAVWNENSVLHQLNEIANELHQEVDTATGFLRNYLYDKYVLVDRHCDGN
ncbi:MAG: hypothetical protein KBT88_12980 [Gammaproteobacteria bacterium]|nr:hypothetical protein [Gammaproteobacteria bacterium]MBQ0840691.1 hypothetical protein [Gammaproteobacteria bacterium]